MDQPIQPPKEPRFVDRNPYKGRKDTIRFVSNIPRDRYNFFYGVCPVNGLQQTTINILLEKLYAKCQQLGITAGAIDSDRRFIDFVLNCNLELVGSTNQGVDGSTGGRAAGGTTATDSSTSPSTTLQSTELPGTVSKGKRTGKSGKGKTKQGT